MKSPPATVMMSERTSASSLRMPNWLRKRRAKVSAAVMSTPHTSGSPKSSCSAMAEPRTSARSQAVMASSHSP